ncbi:MAG: hypothetical protein FWC80_00560 [Firmicutes bacterium]|nr:hypothetical protein [Bacillota bacterium]
MKKKLSSAIVAGIVVCIMLLATACGASAPSAVRNPPSDPDVLVERLESAGWTVTRATAAGITTINAERTNPNRPAEGFDENTRVTTEIVTVQYFSDGILGTGEIAATLAFGITEAAFNLVPDPPSGVTLNTGVWRNGTIVSSWVRVRARASDMGDWQMPGQGS